MADRDVEVDILARDKTSAATRKAARNFTDLKKRVDDSTKSNDKWGKTIGNVTKKVASMAKTVLKGASTVGALVSVAGPAVTGLIGMAKGAVAVGKAVAGMAPLVAFIPSLAGAVGLIAGTLKLAAPGLQTAFQPVIRAFYDADGNATKLTQTIRDLASRGVEPLARQFVKVNLPSIVAAMDQIAMATNGVVTRTLMWINSAEGIALVQTITDATGEAFAKLSPKIDAAVVAMLRLSGRAGDKAITGLADVIGRILDKFTAWADSKSMADINASLDKFKDGWTSAKVGFEHVRDIVDWVVANQAKIHAFTTAIGVFALLAGVVSGAWPAAIIAGIGLLLGNWQKVTDVFGKAKQWWAETWNGIKNDPTLQAYIAAVQSYFRQLGAVIGPTFEKFKTDVIPRLMELKEVIHRDVIPALTDFINAVAPIVVWFASKLLPVVETVFANMVTYITAAMRLISGIINVITAIITGDWSKFWQGIRQILSGEYQALIAIVSSIWAGIKGGFEIGIGVVTALFHTWKDRAVAVFVDAGSWLIGAGKAIVDGLVTGISNAAGRVTRVVGALVDTAKNSIPGPLRAVLGFGGGDSGWRPAQFAAQFAGGAQFAMAGGGTSRVGGPSPVSVGVDVSLDGAPFYAMTSRVVTESERRTAWRNKVGRR